MSNLRSAIERADEKVNHPVRFWLRERAWLGVVVPTAKATWRLVVAASPAIKAIAAAIGAYKMLRP